MDNQDRDAINLFQSCMQRAIDYSPGEVPEFLLFQMSEILKTREGILKLSQQILLKKASDTQNQSHIIIIFEIEKYLAQNNGLQFYTSVSDKHSLQILQVIIEKNKNRTQVHRKIQDTIQKWWELFQPYHKQLYLFYQFYQNNGNKINYKPHNFLSNASLFRSTSNPGEQITLKQNKNKNKNAQQKLKLDISQQAIKFQSEFKRISEENIDSPPGRALFKTIISCYKCQFIVFFFFCIFTSGIYIAVSMLGYKLIQYREQGNQSTSSNLMYFLIYVILYLLVSFIHHYSSYLSFKICYRVNNILIIMIFNKIIHYPMLSDKTFQTAQIINNIQIDSQFFIFLNHYLKFFTIILLQVTVGFGLLFGYIGVSVFTGLGILLGFIVANGIFFFFIAKNSKLLQKARDARIKVAEQILRIIRFVKINTLEKYFLEKIQDKRQNEIKLKRKIGLIKALSNKFLISCSSPLIVMVILLVYLHSGNQVKVSEAFLIVIIFKNIQAVLQNLPDKITFLILIWISAQKIQKFLKANQIREVKIIQQENQKTAVQIQQGKFLWQSNKKIQDKEEVNEILPKKNKSKQNGGDSNPSSASHIIKNSDISCEKIWQQDNKIMVGEKSYIQLFNHLNLRIRSNELTMIIGDVGSGKSSLIFAILGQMATQQQSHQSVHIFGSIAYCPQKPWIINGSVKENILLSNVYEDTRFRESVYYACLDKDIQLLQNGIETEIGEKGVNLSGGQKVRINLARALYANKDIYLLDDILSAVDVNVGQFLMQKTIKTFLSAKTVIMPTHSIKFLHQAHNLIIMNKGNIVQQGSYSKVSQSQHFVRIVSLLEQKKKQISNRQQMKTNKSQERFNRNIAILQKNTKEIVEEDKKVIQSLIIPQKEESDHVSTETYIEFFRFCGGKKFIFGVIILLIGKTSLEITSNIYLQKWCLDENRSIFYLNMFLGFGILSSLFLGILSLFLMFSQNSQNRKIFSKVVNSIIPASLNQFFSRVPQGRLLNRLGKDFAQIDDLLTNMLQSLFGPFLSVISILVIAVYISTFYLFIPIVFVAIFWIWQYKSLLKILKKLFILEKINISGILSNSIQLIDGIDSIRAYKLQRYFFSKHLKQVNINLNFLLDRIKRLSQFFVRVSYVSCLINFTALGFCIFSSSDSSTQIGLLFAYTGYLIEQITGIGYWLVEFQCRMISAQRILKLNQIQPENGYNSLKEHNKIKSQYPKSGEIIFSNYSSRYQKHLPLILKNINLTIQKGQKVGVVGRTGAGKSSMFNCLLRILEPVEGSLTINGKQVRQYEVRDLRESITMIDQEATLIKGTFRQNLDPYDKFSDQQIISTLKQCNLYNIVQDKGGLNSQVSNNSLSVGQKQLMCICRSLLTKNSIVLIDEATANIDVNNDHFIQQVIRKMFSTSTIITIAHRLSTIQDYDKILVLSEGRVIQWGDTKQLLKDKSSIYYQMCERNDQSYLC